MVQHSLDWYHSKYNKLPANIILLQPTSPFRDENDITLAIDKFNKSNKKIGSNYVMMTIMAWFLFINVYILNIIDSYLFN